MSGPEQTTGSVEQVRESPPARASEASRKQRAGTAFTGGFGKKVGSSDLRFVQGQLPERGGTIATDESPSQQLAICLQNLEAQLNQHGREMSDVLQLTLYLTDMNVYEQVNEVYEQYFEESYPARTTVGAYELLGNAAVTIDAVVAIE